MKQFALRLSDEDYEFVRLESKRRKMSMNDYISGLVTEQVRKKTRIKNYHLYNQELWNIYYGLIHEYFIRMYQYACNESKAETNLESVGAIALDYNVERLYEMAVEGGVLKNDWGIAYIQDLVNRIVFYEPDERKKVNPLKENRPKSPCPKLGGFNPFSKKKKQ